MNLAHIFVFTVIGVMAAVFARWRPSLWSIVRPWVMLVVSVVALFWLQPGTPIRNLAFWLPIASLVFTAGTWAITQKIARAELRPTLITGLVIVAVVMLLALLREVELPFTFLAARPPSELLVVIGLVAGTGIVLLMGRAFNLKPRALTLGIVVLIGLLIALKLEPITALLSTGLRALNAQNTAEASARDLSWLGFSYIAFRLIHALRERQNGKLPAMSLREFMIYVVFFPALTAGPIDRSERFIKDLRAPYSAEAADIASADALRRTLIGIFKKFALADTLALIALNEINAGQLRPGLWAWVVVYAYALRIYFDFSGYTDIAIGLGRWFGIKLPENFNRPYLKPNLTQFWNSWHITLSQWFRAYWFNPLARGLRKPSLHLTPVSMIFIGQASTMLLIALWHGITLNFIAWGVWHALGLFVHNRWADWSKTRGWAETSGAWGLLRQVGSIIVTFHFVALGWIWFALPSLDLSVLTFRRLVGQ